MRLIYLMATMGLAWAAEAPQQRPLDVKAGLWESKRTSGDAGVTSETVVERRCVTPAMVASNTAFGEPIEAGARKTAVSSSAAKKEIRYVRADGTVKTYFRTVAERTDSGHVEEVTQGNSNKPVTPTSYEFTSVSEWKWVSAVCK